MRSGADRIGGKDLSGDNGALLTVDDRDRRYARSLFWTPPDLLRSRRTHHPHTAPHRTLLMPCGRGQAGRRARRARNEVRKGIGGGDDPPRPPLPTRSPRRRRAHQLLNHCRRPRGPTQNPVPNKTTRRPPCARPAAVVEPAGGRRNLGGRGAVVGLG
jgi:hypothetical protein